MFNNTPLKRFSAFGYLLPALSVILFFAGYGLYSAFRNSLHLGEERPLFASYQELLLDSPFWESVSISIWVAFSSTVISLVIGIFLTRRLVRLFQRDDWKFAAWFPMLLPHFVAAYIIYLLFAPSGWFSSLAAQIGWIETMSQFPVLVNDPLYTGVILTYVFKEIPFVILMMLPVYQEMDLRYEDVSKTLGGSDWTVFKTVEVPWVMPVSLEVFLILFVFVLGAFEVPALLGVTYPKMLPVLAYEWFYQAAWANRPLAQAMMVLLSAVSLLAAFLILRFTYKWRSHWAMRREDV
ncbi:ABC transporter permease [Salisediminibacterium halotolerans]|uniref:ABC transporter permease n=1 Tax=Salisediminibacterium halotolerans TaxID=517425 RepID=UPI001FE1AC8B|nr:ABC transporter permease subunit [Salisediminibacterium haloalkalitolerans]